MRTGASMPVYEKRSERGAVGASGGVRSREGVGRERADFIYFTNRLFSAGAPTTSFPVNNGRSTEQDGL